MKEGEKSQTKRAIVIMSVITMLVVVVAAAMVVYYMRIAASNAADSQGEAVGGSYVVDESNLTDIKDYVSGKVEAGSYNMVMNTVWHFSDVTKPSYDAYVANSDANHKPMFFEVTLDDTEEIVYTSTVIPVGSAIKEVTLSMPLEPGQYPATCMYNLLNEEGEVDDNVACGITLVIENQ